MYGIDWIIGTGIGAGLLGLLLGVSLGRTAFRGKKAAALEDELADAQQELTEYKAEVFQQFGDTAKKFERLNESYADLHKQLATSASILCADIATGPLLAGPDPVPQIDPQTDSQMVAGEDGTPQDEDQDQDQDQTAGATNDNTPEDVDAEAQAAAGDADTADSTPTKDTV